MSKTVFMFPGQGSQTVGMGKYVYDNYEVSKSCFDTATEVTGIDMKELIFTENERLDNTEYTQIALYTVEMAIYEAMKEKGYKADAFIGLSLGEYSALTASGALSFKDGCNVVRQRGIFMEHAVENGSGAMAAVLGMTGEAVNDVIEKLKCNELVNSDDGVDYSKLCVANYNCPGQIVISGEKNAVIKACEYLKEAGAKRTVELNVSGPFHSPMLKKAGEQLKEVLDDINFDEVNIPYVANLTADYVRDNKEIKDILIEQVYSPVKFEQSVRRLIEDGYDTFVEIGPGKTLNGFVKKIAKDMGVDNIEISSVSGEEI